MGDLENIDSDMAEIIGAQGMTCSIGDEDDIPCSFSASGGVELGFFAEQDTASARLLISVADIPDSFTDPQDMIGEIATAPDGNEYRVERQAPDGYGGAVLLTLADPTGKLGG